MRTRLSALRGDQAAEKLLDKDLSAYISAENLAPFPFEYKPKRESANPRISTELLDAVRAAARRRGFRINGSIGRRWRWRWRGAGKGRAASKILSGRFANRPYEGLKRGRQRNRIF